MHQLSLVPARPVSPSLPHPSHPPHPAAMCRGQVGPDLSAADNTGLVLERLRQQLAGVAGAGLCGADHLAHVAARGSGPRLFCGHVPPVRPPPGCLAAAASPPRWSPVRWSPCLTLGCAAGAVLCWMAGCRLQVQRQLPATAHLVGDPPLGRGPERLLPCPQIATHATCGCRFGGKGQGKRHVRQVGGWLCPMQPAQRAVGSKQAAAKRQHREGSTRQAAAPERQHMQVLPQWQHLSSTKHLRPVGQSLNSNSTSATGCCNSPTAASRFGTVSPEGMNKPVPSQCLSPPPITRAQAQHANQHMMQHETRTVGRSGTGIHQVTQQKGRGNGETWRVSLEKLNQPGKTQVTSSAPCHAAVSSPPRQQAHATSQWPLHTYTGALCLSATC